MNIGIVLTLIFVTLKLAEIGVVAEWSWWWVLSPLWISFTIFVMVTVVQILFISKVTK